jgi:hypothetical protein
MTSAGAQQFYSASASLTPPKLPPSADRERLAFVFSLETPNRKTLFDKLMGEGWGEDLLLTPKQITATAVIRETRTPRVEAIYLVNDATKDTAEKHDAWQCQYGLPGTFDTQQQQLADDGATNEGAVTSASGKSILGGSTSGIGRFSAMGSSKRKRENEEPS